MGTVEYTAEEETGRSSPYHDSQAVLPLTCPTTTTSPQQLATVPVSSSPLFHQTTQEIRTLVVSSETDRVRFSYQTLGRVYYCLFGKKDRKTLRGTHSM
jgi:hypothetical protein